MKKKKKNFFVNVEILLDIQWLRVNDRVQRGKSLIKQSKYYKFNIKCKIQNTLLKTLKYIKHFVIKSKHEVENKK